MDRFDMGPLGRLGLWAGGAALAIGLVVVAAQTEAGSRRLAAAVSTVGAPAASAHNAPGLTPAPIQSRPAAPDPELRRLAGEVQKLSADRERLVARLAALERSLEDVTGSIVRQAKASPPPAAEPPPLPIIPSVTVPPPSPATAEAGPAEPAAPEPPQAQALRAQASQTEAPASVPPQIGWAASVAHPGAFTAPAERFASAGASSAEANAAQRPQFGVDIGGGSSMAGLRALWQALRTAQPAHLDNLRAVVAVREGPRGATELRLIAGPLVSAGAAARVCESLSAAGHTCSPAMFDGQRLAGR